MLTSCRQWRRLTIRYIILSLWPVFFFVKHLTSYVNSSFGVIDIPLVRFLLSSKLYVTQCPTPSDYVVLSLWLIAFSWQKRKLAGDEYIYQLIPGKRKVKFGHLSFVYRYQHPHRVAIMVMFVEKPTSSQHTNSPLRVPNRCCYTFIINSTPFHNSPFQQRPERIHVRSAFACMAAYGSNFALLSCKLASVVVIQY